MATSQIPKSDWQNYFDQVSKRHREINVEIEVSSLKLGDQIVTRPVPFHGMSYDPKDGTFDVFAEGLEHLIHDPKAIYIEEDNLLLQSVEVLTDDDTRHIIRFH